MSLVLDERELNSNTAPFPLCRHIPSNAFVPESVSELDATDMSGVSFVETEDREAMLISLSVSEPVATLTSEHLLSNGALIRMVNVQSVSCVYTTSNIEEVTESISPPSETVAF